MDGKFATAINCMDGRAQIPVIDYLTAEYGVDYVDMITAAGPNKIIAEKTDENILSHIKRRVEISANKHGAETLSIVGHFDCAGNPVGAEKQKEHIKKAVANMKEWGFSFKTIVGLWVGEDRKVVKVL